MIQSARQLQAGGVNTMITSGVYAFKSEGERLASAVKTTTIHVQHGSITYVERAVVDVQTKANGAGKADRE